MCPGSCGGPVPHDRARCQSGAWTSSGRGALTRLAGVVAWACGLASPMAASMQHRCAYMLLRTALDNVLVVARKLTTSREMLLWMTPSEAPKALQASECSELLDPMRASCWISAQH